jgi:hypothetical protein
MISHYVNNSKKYKRLTNKKQKEGQNQSDKAVEDPDNSIALLLLSPCKKEVQSLKHITRLALNKKLAKKSAKANGLTIENLTNEIFSSQLRRL